jgi:hypothetical protein
MPAGTVRGRLIVETFDFLTTGQMSKIACLRQQRRRGMRLLVSWL